ncbi:MAG: hypothetical protein KDC95_13510 [Planctomycetes bacterium]|nr:hypothetical protein [Planctomycetota bacterium]
MTPAKNDNDESVLSATPDLSFADDEATSEVAPAPPAEAGASDAKSKPPCEVLDATGPALEMPESEVLYWYWIGAFDYCPFESVHVAGLAFQKYTELLRRTNSMGRTERIRMAGQVLKLSRSKLRLLAEKLQRRILRCDTRFDVPPDETHGGVDFGDRRRGLPAAILTIPTKEEEEAMRQNPHRSYRPFVPQRGDRPVSQFIYCVLLDEAQPAHRIFGTDLPPPLSETGIMLPTSETIVAADDLKPRRVGFSTGKGHEEPWLKGLLQPKAKPIFPKYPYGDHE